jgi:hypothetical protein
VKTQRIEGLVQVLILIAIAGMAGAASFTHVHNWTMSNAPHGTGSWFGWVNAIISDLTPTAAGIEIRRRKRNGHQPVGYPMAILIAAAVLSLSAQVAEARPTIGGWISSAVPALAFLGLTKLILSRPAPITGESSCSQNQNQAGTQAPTATGTTTPDGSKSPSGTTAPPAEHSPEALSPAQSPSSASAMTFPAKTGSSASAASSAPTSASADSAREPETDTLGDLVPVPSGQLLMSGRMTAFAHLRDTGQPITPGQLAERLGVAPALAESILDHLDDGITPSVTAVNGTALNGSRP